MLLPMLLPMLAPVGRASGQTKGSVLTSDPKGARLPAPALTARSFGPGCVHVTWTPVAGAKSYVLGRQTDNNGYQRVYDLPQRPVTEYFDNSFRKSTMVAYRVTAIDSSDGAGMPSTSTVISAMGGDVRDCSRPPATSDVVATIAPEGIVLRWGGSVVSSLERYEIRHVVNGKPFPTERAEGTHTLTFPATPGEHVFQVFTVDASGRLSDPAPSNTLSVDATPTSTASASPTASGGVGALVGGAELSFAVREAMSLRVGSSRAAGGPGGAQWSSLDSGVASVTADGTVTGRAAGEARVVGVSAGGGGGVRVTVVRVVVTP